MICPDCGVERPANEPIHYVAVDVPGGGVAAVLCAKAQDRGTRERLAFLTRRLLAEHDAASEE